MELNKVHNIDFLNNTLPDKCANLIIADPPYFEVKGDFDFIWESFEDYLIDVEKWTIECKRLLADNGTLFWWGHAKKIAYSQIILDKYFNLENVIKWHKYDSRANKGAYNYRSFAPVTEHLLMYSNEIGMSALSKILHTIDLWKPIIEKLNKNIVSKKQCYEIFKKDGRYTSEQSLIVQTKNKFGWGNRFDFMDEKLFDLCKEELKFDFTYKQIYDEYVILLNKYKNKFRTFNNYTGLTDVWKFSQEASVSKNYDHDTQKTETISRIIINTCSNKNDLVVIPFSGSGTEVSMAIKEGRNSIGFDVEEKHCNTSNNRIKNILKTPTLFT